MTTFFSLAVVALAAADSPDVVLIMADDLGYGDVSLYHENNPLWPDAPPPSVKTPNLDELGRRGVRFLDFHSNGPVCSPTRAALLTGRYQQRAGLPIVIYADPKQSTHRHGLAPAEVTLADALRDAGYATAVFGKWHLGYDVAFNPLRNGFDEFCGYVSGNIDYFTHLDRMGQLDWWEGERLRPQNGYSTDLISDGAAARLDAADPDERLFVYVAHECPHDPIQPPDGEPVRRLGHVGNMVTPKGQQRDDFRRAMIEAMDAGIGRIADAAARRAKLTGRPVVLIFCSDNGAVPFGDNGPWRGNKGQLYEGGHHVPLLIATFGRELTPRDSRRLSASMDLMPTVLELAGVAAPTGLDGVSLAIELRGGPDAVAGPDLFFGYREQYAMRRDAWKLVLPRKGSAELYDLAADPSESEDLAESQPDRLAEMTAALRRWRKDVEQSARVQPGQPQFEADGFYTEGASGLVPGK